MKGLSQYMSALVLLLLSMIGMGIVASYSIHVRNVVKGLNDNYCRTSYGVSYIGYSDGYIYLYNSGSSIELRTSIEVLNTNKWMNASLVPRGSVFRIRSTNPTAILITRNGCVLVIKP